MIIVKSDEEIIRKKTRRRGRCRSTPRGSGSWQGIGSGETVSTVASTLATGAEATFEIFPITDSEIEKIFYEDYESKDDMMI